MRAFLLCPSCVVLCVFGVTKHDRLWIFLFKPLGSLAILFTTERLIRSNTEHANWLYRENVSIDHASHGTRPRYVQNPAPQW